MSQIEQLNININSIAETINGTNKSINTGQPNMHIKQHFMTDRQIMKKLIMVGGDMSGIPNPYALDIQMSEESAHSLVYGKLTYDDKGKLVDDEVNFPECVDKKSKVKKSHPMKMWIKNKKLEVGIAFDQLKSKSVEISLTSTQLGVETTAAFITIGSSAAILPIGAGIPTAFSALQGIFASLQAFQTKINQILPILEPLTFIAILIFENVIETVVGMINTLLGTITLSLNAVAALLSPITQLKGIIGTEPQTPGLQLNSVSASPSTIQSGNKTTLNATVSNGSWQYEYIWTDKTTGSIISQNQQVEVEPLSSRTYSCSVVDGKAIVYGEVAVIVGF